MTENMTLLFHNYRALPLPACFPKQIIADIAPAGLTIYMSDRSCVGFVREKVFYRWESVCSIFALGKWLWMSGYPEVSINGIPVEFSFLSNKEMKYRLSITALYLSAETKVKVLAAIKDKYRNRKVSICL